MSRRFYITTAIPYVNSRPHLGFALELVQADVLARYHRLVGDAVRLQTGTDENAFKNVLAARAQGVSTRALVDDNAAFFRRLAESLNVSHDHFIRTADAGHARAVRRLWRNLTPGDLYRRRYTGLYCVGCEDFLLERDLVNGRCPDHNAPPASVNEENWFFRLSAYQSKLESLIGKGQIAILPESRRNEVLSFIRNGLLDISVSRPADRCGGWGIHVPDDDGQIVYVWIDALVNYISGIGYGRDEDWRTWWTPESVTKHVIGKNVWKFHAVYWPALLLSARLPPPDRIVVHGFLTENGRKISKSAGASINPSDCINSYGADGVRYYLLRAVSPFEDGDVSLDRLRDLYNADLANGLGNLVSRLQALGNRTGGWRSDLPLPGPAPEGYHSALAACEFDHALRQLWCSVAQLNQDIERVRPWQALRDGNSEAVLGDIERWRTALNTTAHWLEPFLPQTSRLVRRRLSTLDAAAEPLFPRLK